MASLDQTHSLKEQRVVICWARLGFCLQSLPQTPLPGRKVVSVLGQDTSLAGVGLVWLYSPEPPQISEELQQFVGGSHYRASSVTLRCFLQADAEKCPLSADTEDGLCLSNGELQKQTEELPSHTMLASWHLCKTTRNCLLPLSESKPQSPSRRGLKPWSATHLQITSFLYA